MSFQSFHFVVIPSTWRSQFYRSWRETNLKGLHAVLYYHGVWAFDAFGPTLASHFPVLCHGKSKMSGGIYWKWCRCFVWCKSLWWATGPTHSQLTY